MLARGLYMWSTISIGFVSILNATGKEIWNCISNDLKLIYGKGENMHVELEESMCFWDQVGQGGLAVVMGDEGPEEWDMWSRKLKHIQNLRSAQPCWKHIPLAVWPQSRYLTSLFELHPVLWLWVKLCTFQGYAKDDRGGANDRCNLCLRCVHVCVPLCPTLCDPHGL